MKEIIENVLEKYDLGNLEEFKELSSGFANENYRVKTNSSEFLFRICKQQPLKYIQFELELLKVLKENNFPTAYVYSQKNGDQISETSLGKVVLYEFKKGAEPEINALTSEAMASAIAELNSIKNWAHLKKENSVHINLCLPLIKEFKDAKFQHPEVFEYFEEQTNYLLEPLNRPLPKGIVHGDAFPDNTIFKDNQLVSVIDLEEACIDHLLFDVGITLNGFGFIDNTLNKDLAQTFLKKYNEIRPLSEEEKELLPYYLIMGAHGMIYWHLKNGMLTRKNQSQIDRVHELMERCKLLRNDPDFISKISI